MFGSGNKQLKEMSEIVEQHERHIAAFQADRDVLKRELGTYAPDAIVAQVRGLEAKVTELTPPPMEEEESLLALSDPRQVLGKIRSFTSKIQSLNGTVGSMEEQLMSLYEDKETLEREIGASEVEDVIEAFRGLQTTIDSMESQLMTLYASREMLDVELGKSDPREIVAMVKNIAHMVKSAQIEMESVAMDEEAASHNGGFMPVPSPLVNSVYAREGAALS